MTTIKITGPDHWHQLRREHGGSSEAPALFGLGYADMPSRWSLWALKTGKWQPDGLEASDRVWFGQELEAVIARAVTRQHGWDLVDTNEYVTHPAEIFKMGATVDRMVVEHEDGPGIVETKNRDYLQWSDAYTDTDASVRDKLQLAHQMACMPEVTWGCVAVLVGGNTLKTYTYKRGDLGEMIMQVEEAWRTFWLDLEAGHEPSLTGDEIPPWLKVHIHVWEPEDELEITGEDSDSLDAIITKYLASDALAKVEAKVAKECKAAILQAADENGRVRTNMHRIKINPSQIKESTSTRRAHVRATIKAEVDPRPKADPDALAAGFASQAPLPEQE